MTEWSKSDLYRQKRYGLSYHDIKAKLEEQHGKCYGCWTDIDESTCVDHDHESGKVRGLLCKSCNWALGQVSEDQATLYQLAAYLDIHKRENPLVYLIGSLRNPKILEAGAALREAGLEVFDSWFAAGPEADDAWQEYCRVRGFSYREALEEREARHVFLYDRAYLRLAKAAVLVLPAGKSGHLKAGYALDLGKRVWALGEHEGRYEVMHSFVEGESDAARLASKIAEWLKDSRLPRFIEEAVSFEEGAWVSCSELRVHFLECTNKGGSPGSRIGTSSKKFAEEERFTKRGRTQGVTVE